MRIKRFPRRGTQNARYANKVKIKALRCSNAVSIDLDGGLDALRITIL